MKTIVRFFLTFVSAISSFYFVFWVVGGILFALHLPHWLSLVAALVAGIAVARYVWRNIASLEGGLLSSIGFGAVLLGGVGFAVGFFGPMIFTPGANQGPLLGIFITGPLGVFLGAAGGAIYWFGWGRRRKHAS